MMLELELDADDAARTMTGMITEGASRSAAGWLPYLLLSALSGLLMMGGDPMTELLRYERAAVASGEWWRLLSANFVHLGWWHWSVNVAGLALLVFLCPERPSIREWLTRIILIGIGLCLGLHLFTPELKNYVGLSGLAYGLFVFGLTRQVVAGDRFALACLGFVVARIVWELVIGAPKSEEALIGGSIVAESHLYGAVVAVIYGVLSGAFRRPAQAAAV